MTLFGGFFIGKLEGMAMKSSLAGIGLLIWIMAAWITHVVVCFKSASWGFLIAGALFFPVAWFHGTGIWFNWW